MLSQRDWDLIKRLQQGLPICSRPYAQLGADCAMSESEVLERLTRLTQRGVVKRFGVVVKHERLGYRANAMIVWNIPDEQVAAVAQCMCQFSFVTLCYQRPRCADWQYNLYCMIHGTNRATVLAQFAQLKAACQLNEVDCQVLFSLRCFKQRGAMY